MQHRRNEVFLATKTRERSRDGALHDIEQSLKLMNTDHVDLWLLHNIGIPEEVNAVFAKGGALLTLLLFQSGLEPFDKLMAGSTLTDQQPLQ